MRHFLKCRIYRSIIIKLLFRYFDKKHNYFLSTIPMIKDFTQAHICDKNVANQKMLFYRTEDFDIETIVSYMMQ